MHLDPKIHPYTAIRNGSVLGHFSNPAAAIQTIQYEGRGFIPDYTEVHNRFTGQSLKPTDFIRVLREAEATTRKYLQGRFLSNL